MNLRPFPCPTMALLAAALALGAACGGAALAQTAFDSSFDHFTTSWPLEGAHRSVDCASCHVGGVFQGTPRLCGTCHARAGLVKAQAPPFNHIRTVAECDACHRESSWSYILAVDHSAVAGTCAGCHDGRTATGKPPRHVPTGADCEACHSTRAWYPVE
ncbi:MAG: hypothetical protein IT486_11085 [Gammaproteobacteria bacterium]|nr:hypothetical protein [Gammaproteobacteria bacterium]